MIRGLYLAGTGMLYQRNNMDVITNNLANVDTGGFRQEQMLSRSFSDMMLERKNDPAVVRASREVGPLNTGIHIDEILTSFSQGPVEQTGLNTDMAIQGDGFFVVDTPEGERYTRAGNFTLTNEGILVDSEGNHVQGEGGEIRLESDRFLVKENGTIYNEDTGAEVGRLRIVEFEEPDNLRQEAGTRFYEYQDAGLKDAEKSEVLQGYIEGSNVSTVDEMVDMLVASRAYESAQRAVGMIDETLDSAVNSIARF